MTEKVDFKRSLDGFQARQGEFRILEMPVMRYLMVDGHGDPNSSPAYDDALGALYPLAYACKFASKRELGRDYVVPPLEGLWWADDLAVFTTARDKSAWDWTMMIMLPTWVEQGMVDAAREKAAVKAGRRARSTGRHHEIYLSDPRRTAPERLRTILRQPVT